LLVLLTGTAPAFDYSPTPLTESIAEHEIVVVGQVTRRIDDAIELTPTQAIKGKPQQGLRLPAVWRPGTEWSFGPVRLEPGKTYVLMLQERDGTYALSSDHASEAVTLVESGEAPFVKVIRLLTAMSKEPDEQQRASLLTDAYDALGAKGRRRLCTEFYVNGRPDRATVPFLARCIEDGATPLACAAMAAMVVAKYNYSDAVPALLQALNRGDGGNLYAARALGKMQVRAAYEPIVRLIEDETVGNRPYFIEALAELEDPRAIPLFLKTLHRGLDGLDPNRGTYRSWSVQECEFAAEALGRLKAPEAVGPLIVLLDPPKTARYSPSHYKKLRDNAIVALGRIGPPAKQVLPVLQRLMREARQDTDGHVGNSEPMLLKLTREAITAIERPASNASK
jgi:HEAT repeat protein